MRRRRQERLCSPSGTCGAMTRRMFTSSGGGSPAGRPAKRWLLFIVVSLPLLAQSRRQQFLEHRNVAQRDSAARLVQPPSSLPFQFLATFDDASALPQCSFTAPKNGTVAGCAKVNAGASCQDFKCAVGFRKAGSFRCRKEEQKSGNTTTTLAKNGGVGTCERIFCANATAAKPPKNSTGTFGCTKIASGEKCVDFGCTVGFAKTGQFVCKKGGSGLETSGTCERRYCRADAPKNVSNLTEFNRTCGRVASGETCPKFQCSVGFKATGSFVCAKDGSALTGKGKCERIYCPLVKPPNNISKPDAFNRTCGRLASGTSCKEFVCETGFAPKNSFVCSKDGSRIEERGSCERVFCKAISPPANVKDAAGFNRTCGKLASGTGCKPSGVGVAPKPDGSVGDGSRVTDLGTGGRWQCAAGFGAVGEYQCAKDGLSVVKTGSCVRLLCPDVVKPAHAASSSYSCPALMKANSTCQVSCDVGWRSTAGKSAHVCPITGGKLKTVAQCERVYCEKIPAPANSTNFNCSRIASGESCDVRCAVGFLPAEKTIKCAKNGLSVVQNATCERVFCKVLAVPPHAQGFSCNRIPSGEVCSLKCAVGWAPKGQFKCNPAGTEVVEKGECKRLYCEDIPPPQNASLAKFNCSKIASGDSCDIQCDKGFSVKGKFKCNADATGLDEKPVCDRKKIEKIPAPANSANFKCGSINSGEICKVDCATGYRPVSNFTVDKAGDNLLYNASCERKTCSDIPAPRNSTKFNCMKIKSGELCNITCIHGFDIVDYFQCSKSGEEVVRNATCKRRSTCVFLSCSCGYSVVEESLSAARIYVVIVISLPSQLHMFFDFVLDCCINNNIS